MRVELSLCFPVGPGCALGLTLTVLSLLKDLSLLQLLWLPSQEKGGTKYNWDPSVYDSELPVRTQHQWHLVQEQAWLRWAGAGPGGWGVGLPGGQGWAGGVGPGK